MLVFLQKLKPYDKPQNIRFLFLFILQYKWRSTNVQIFVLVHLTIQMYYPLHHGRMDKGTASGGSREVLMPEEETKWQYGTVLPSNHREQTIIQQHCVRISYIIISHGREVQASWEQARICVVHQVQCCDSGAVAAPHSTNALLLVCNHVQMLHLSVKKYLVSAKGGSTDEA